MNQNRANMMFSTDLGQQLSVIFSTSDDQVFIRHEEALAHTNQMANANPESFVDTTIEEWYREEFKISTIGELREAIKAFSDEDQVVVEIHEGMRSEDLYQFYVDSIDGVILVDENMTPTNTVKEIRLCI